MQKGKSSIILDTNILISFLLMKQDTRFDSLIANGEVILVFSKELLKELVEVTGRTKFKKYFETKGVENLILKIRNRAVFIEAMSDVSVCRDTKDNFLLSLAKDAHANYLITGDSDLLVLKTFGRTKIITLTDYLMKL
jgi:uncharacterized protein